MLIFGPCQKDAPLAGPDAPGAGGLVTNPQLAVAS